MHMRPYFRARTVNDNGPGAESAASNAFSVGRPKAPAVQATGSSTGVKVAFTPDTPETGDTWVYWAEDASVGGGERFRLDEATVGSVTIREGEHMVGSGLASTLLRTHRKVCSRPSHKHSPHCIRSPSLFPLQMAPASSRCRWPPLRATTSPGS